MEDWQYPSDSDVLQCIQPRWNNPSPRTILLAALNGPDNCFAYMNAHYPGGMPFNNSPVCAQHVNDLVPVRRHEARLLRSYTQSKERLIE